ncbi:MAG: hypothetical protein KAJ07_00440 [Planctomycetes bacterium]|nr:hypothetical protein [Planctomycetota bacterium]
MSSENAEEIEELKFDDLEGIHKAALKEHKVGSLAVHRNHRLAYEDVRFLDGADSQWTEEELASRKSRGAPVLTVNALPTFVNQVVGDIMLNTPMLKAIPVDEFADKETARVIDGLFRNIGRRSKGDRVFKHGGKQSVGHGFGYMEVFTEYTGKDSFEQDIKFRSIKNSFSVIPDEEAEDITLSDQNKCFVEKRMTRDAFKRRWPGEEITDFTQARSKFNGAEYARWFMQNEVLIAKYYKRFKRTVEILQLEDGRVIKADDLLDDKALAKEVKGIKIKQKREAIYYEVYSYIMSGDKILEGPDKIMSQSIPVIRIAGQTQEIGDYTVLRGLIRHSKDAMRMKNYWLSTIAESLTTAPKTPYLATKKHVEGYENIWRNANRYNYAYLPYNIDPQAPGTVPQRTPPAFLPEGAFVQYQKMGEELKNTTGLFEASIGARSNERTGAAIEARERSGDIGTFEYIDNLNDAIVQLGEVIMEMIPNVYDTQRVIRLLNPDNKTIETITINNRVFDPNDSRLVLTENDLSVGKYDVAIEIGPNFTTQRQETARKMTEFLQVLNDQQKALVVDMIPSALDFKGADEMQRRLQVILPKGILPEEAGQPQQPQPPTPAEELEAQKLQVESEKNQVAAGKNDVEMAKVQLEAAKVAQEAEDADARTREIVLDTIEEINAPDEAANL